MTSAFIIEVNSQFQPDANEETAALLRVLIHKVDNTTFGGDVPTVPQPWTGPPHVIVQVQAILFASLAASLFSAFLAMLGKQWLNRYTSVDMRGSAIERSQNRQRKLDGIVNWYFDYVMESLPLMLQGALLLLGCALSRYLWGINKAVASVVLGITSFGIIFYLFIVIAGAAAESCPYQTPCARILRRIPDTLHHVPEILHRIQGFLHHIPDTLPDIHRRIPRVLGAPHQAFSALPEVSFSFSALVSTWEKSPYLLVNIALLLSSTPLLLILLVADVCRATIWLLVMISRRVYFWLWQKLEQLRSQRELGQLRSRWESGQLRLRQESEQQTAVLDLQCIFWTLRTSLDGPVRLSTLNYLATTTLANLDLTFVVDCFDILFGHVKAINDEAVITQGTEGLAAASALCCLHTISHLTTTDPASRVLDSIRQRYTKAFPFSTQFNDLPFSHILDVIHGVFYPHRSGQAWWGHYKPSSNEHAVVSHALAKLARFEYQRSRRKKVPRWLLRFALHSLSQSLLPPTSVVVNCLSIIAVDLGDDLPNTAMLRGRYVRVKQISAFLTKY